MPLTEQERKKKSKKQAASNNNFLAPVKNGEHQVKSEVRWTIFPQTAESGFVSVGRKQLRVGSIVQPNFPAEAALNSMARSGVTVSLQTTRGSPSGFTLCHFATKISQRAKEKMGFDAIRRGVFQKVKRKLKGRNDGG